MPMAMAAMKMKGSSRSDTTAPMAGPGQNPDSPQPTPKIAAPGDETGIDVGFGRPPEALGEQRLGRQHELVADEGGDDGAAEHEHERRVEGAGEIEEIEHLGRVDHARQRQPGAEQQA
jgi:hypothetical protein